MELRSMSSITIKLERPYVEELFKRYEDLIGSDFPAIEIMLIVRLLIQ
jgi:hypothetical protein